MDVLEKHIPYKGDVVHEDYCSNKIDMPLSVSFILGEYLHYGGHLGCTTILKCPVCGMVMYHAALVNQGDNDDELYAG